MLRVASFALALSVIGPAIANDFVGYDCVVDEVLEAVVDDILIPEEDPMALNVSLLQHAYTHKSGAQRNTGAGQQQEASPSDSTNESGVGKPLKPALIFDANHTDAFETVSGKMALLSAGTVASTVWEHFDFDGRSLHLDVSTEYLPDQWNDQISSFIVNPGYCVTFYEDFNYNGFWWRLCAGFVPYKFGSMMHGMNDRVSSLMLSRKHDDGLAATVFEHTGFSGLKWDLRQSTLHAGFMNDHISSFEVRPFYCATFYTDANYGGAWRQYCAGSRTYRVSNLVSTGWNDRVSSIWLSRKF